ncbi:MAG: hypothetical protein ATN32_04045 [Candidatus Epulonipiscium fishelsonii]|nr:MAG: hypothetical protein ATN32_04045 [Epulopiscium sp. AS2M-Bin002]
MKKFMLLTLALGIGLSQTTFAYDATGIRLEDVDYTRENLFEDDEVEIVVSVIGSSDKDTQINQVSIKGEAIDTSEMDWEVYQGGTNNRQDDTELGMSELVDIKISGLTYTGVGNELTVTVSTGAGSVSEDITLNAISNDTITGALVLDPKVESNMSMSINAGETKSMGLTIKNTSDIDLVNSVVKINFAETTVGLAIEEGNYIDISSIKYGRSHEVYFVVSATEDVPRGTYKINAEINGMNQIIWLEVKNSSNSPTLNISYDNTQFQSGASNPLTLNIQNSGKEVAHNVKLNLQSKEVLGLAGSSSMLNLGSIEGGDMVQLDLALLIEELEEDRLLVADFEVTYETEQGEVISEIQKLYIDAKGAEEETEILPSLSISYDTSQAFQAGQVNPLTLVIENTGDIIAENIKLNLKSGDNFGVFGSTSLITIGSLYVGEERLVNLELFISEMEENQLLNAEVQVTYEADGESINETQQIYIDAKAGEETADTAPSISLSYNASKAFFAGQTNTLSLIVKNIGDEAAKNVKLNLQSGENLGIAGSGSLINLGPMEIGEEKHLNLNLLIEDFEENKLLTADFLVTCEMNDGKVNSENQQIYLNAIGNEEADTNENAQVTFKNIFSPTGTILPGQEFEVSFSIISSGYAEDIEVSLGELKNIVPISQNKFMIDSLSPNTPKTFTIKMIATDEAATQNHPIELLVKYEYDDEIQTEAQYANVYVYNEEADDDDATSLPKVIIGGYSFSTETIHPGDEVTVHVDLLNTNSEQSVNNLTATYSSSLGQEFDSQQIITPVGSGNTLYTSYIAPESTVTQTFSFKVANDAGNQSYSLEIEFDYETEDAEKLTSKEAILFTVTEEGRIEVGEISTTTLTQGKSNDLTIPLYNRGKSDLENVMISLEGNGFTVSDNQLYINSFTEGGTEYYLPIVTPNTDKIQIALVAEFEDSAGNMQTTSYPLHFDVKSSQSPSRDQQFMFPEGMPAAMPGKPNNMQGGMGMPSDMAQPTDDSSLMSKVTSVLNNVLNVFKADPNLMYACASVVGLLGVFMINRKIKKRKNNKFIEDLDLGEEDSKQLTEGDVKDEND